METNNQNTASEIKFKKSVEKKMNKKNNDKKDSKSTIVIILLIIIIIIILLWRGCGGKSVSDSGTITPTTVITPEPTPESIPDGPVEGSGYLNEGDEYDPEKIKQLLNEKQYNCTMICNSYIEFANLQSEGVLNLQNVNDLYVQVHLIPKDSTNLGDAYFTSIIVPPNEEMNKIKLDKNLDKLKEGQQRCLLVYDCFIKPGDEYIRVGNSAAEVIVNVLSLQ